MDWAFPAKASGREGVLDADRGVVAEDGRPVATHDEGAAVREAPTEIDIGGVAVRNCGERGESEQGGRVEVGEIGAVDRRWPPRERLTAIDTM
eukprot:3651360-Pyramimonas_sp.AAC.1